MGVNWIASALGRTMLGCVLLVAALGAVSAEDLDKHVAIRDAILLISTLDGSLHAVGQRTGIVKWSISDVPILQMSPMANMSDEPKHLLLPDPKDGTLYLVNGFSEKQQKPLEKLPFTISELVSTSPCRSSDGMIYTSKKMDEWIVVDVVSGEKIDIINVDSPMCPTRPTTADHLPTKNAFDNKHYNNRDLLYLFKSEYQISVFNAESREKLSNFTFVDYSPSVISSIPQSSYEFLHLTSSTNGKLATIDIANGANTFLWSQQFSSPIVAMYKMTENANFPVISRIPFLTIGGFINISNIQHNSLFPSVYIGELTQSKSLYALSALVDYNQIRKDSSYLIEGPKDDSQDELDRMHLAGYYEYPKATGIKFNRIRPSELIPSAPVVPNVGPQKESTEDVIPPIALENLANQLDNWTSLYNNLVMLITVLITLIVVVPVTIAVAYHHVYKKEAKATPAGSSSGSLSTTSTNSSSGASMSIGKISYNCSDIIGRGCAGTCVYKGLFEGRQQVAVKRIVADCFQLANREIELLRKLQHPHLIRYFATENDQQFLYIAIELAELTLAEYIERRSDQTMGYEFNKTEILYQSCLGLAHLHSLNIVHRDIKPQNILISQPISPNQSRKIMISDFGVSKILNSESLTTEFSAGTEGWIAPEILHSKLKGINTKASKPNDIFSMGCLIYYTYTHGEHPFGNLLNRQSNIINGQADLSAIKEEDHVAVYSLVESMVTRDPEGRPPIEAVVKHPFFWNSKQSLQFLQDISDRIESEKSADSAIVGALEYCGTDVYRGDWRRRISVELQEDLRKFRNYKGNSVRDLLRAIRNKRHHYHELDPKLQSSLGSIPTEFVTYFTSKFPRLITHCYIAMQICRHEDIFQNYYHFVKDSENNYKFKNLPKSGIAWYEMLKDERSKAGSFVFDRSPRAKKFANSNNNKCLEEREEEGNGDLVNHSKQE